MFVPIKAHTFSVPKPVMGGRSYLASEDALDATVRFIGKLYYE